jgi:hypothetical protein
MTAALFQSRVLDRNNDAARRFFGMGFTLDRVQFDDGGYIWRYEAHFRCVCGRREAVGVAVSPEMLADAPYLLDDLNLFRVLDRKGAMSREHLLNDGYTPAEIDDMERRVGKGLI